MIYEDTNCIKSLNLLGPKVLENIGASSSVRLKSE